MLGLPKSTEIKKPLNKTTIYEKFHMDHAAQKQIDADISRISFVNELSPGVIHIPAGEEVKQIFVMQVLLKRKNFDPKSIAVLSKLITQKMLFILELNGESILAVYPNRLIHTEWKPTEQQIVELRGLNLDKVWYNIVKDIEGGVWNDALSIEENIAIHEKQRKLEKQIEKLERQARAEKQPKKKFELAEKVKKLKKELEE